LHGARRDDLLRIAGGSYDHYATMPVTVRDAIFDLMRRFGMTCVFGNPGSTELPMFRGFPRDFRYILGLQEAVVVGMADGYTMASGGLGWSMPAAVGIALAKPKDKIIAIIGDGSSMYSIQALWSAAQLKLLITFIVLKNRRYAALKDFAPVFGYGEADRVQGTDLPGLDFAGMARAQGCEAIRVTAAPELRDALTRALQSPSPFLLEVEVA
jgi:thiamine pyrophosphate-dependent acetolactate synthase large subunit-like protein